MTKEKLEKFIKESVLDETQFQICHELRGHCITKHIVDINVLQERVWNMPRPTVDEPIKVATRFLSEESARQLIYETLIENVKDIANWRSKLYTKDYEITKEFDIVTGEGIVKGADKNQLIPMHAVRIIICNGDYFGQPFYIKTAYPFRSFDDIDACYDAIDEFQARKMKNKK